MISVLTRLLKKGRALTMLLRSVWLLISLITFVFAAISVFTFSTELRKPCDLPNRPIECDDFQDVALEEMGISRNFFANMLTAGVIVQVLPWFIAGTILFLKRSDDLFSILLSLSMFTVVVGILDQGILSWARWRLPDFAWVVRGLFISGQLFSIIWIFFPSVRKISIGLFLFAAYLVLNAVGWYFFSGTWMDNSTWPDSLALLNYSFIVITFISIFIQRYRTSSRPVKQQIKWILWAFSLLAFTHLAVRISLTYATMGTTIVLMRLTLVPLQYISSALAAFAILAAMLRYRLFEIDLIIRRTFSYAALTGILVAVYFGGVVILQNIFGTVVGQANSPLITVISTLAIAALFNTLRLRIQDFIDRRFYRARYDAEQTLAHFAATARDEVDLETISTAVLGIVNETMQPEMASLWLKSIRQGEGSSTFSKS